MLLSRIPSEDTKLENIWHSQSYLQFQLITESALFDALLDCWLSLKFNDNIRFLIVIQWILHWFRCNINQLKTYPMLVKCCQVPFMDNPEWFIYVLSTARTDISATGYGCWIQSLNATAMSAVSITSRKQPNLPDVRARWNCYKSAFIFIGWRLCNKTMHTAGVRLDVPSWVKTWL